MALGRYLVQRIIFLIFTFLILLVLNFMLPRALPGSPISRFVNPLMTPAIQQQILASFGLTKPLYVQFVLYLRGTFAGNFGISFMYYPTPVRLILEQRLPWTVFLVGSATIISSLIGIFLGLMSGWRSESKTDSSIILSSMFLRSIPTFWLGLILLIAFAVTWRIFPVSGYFSTSVALGQSNSLQELESIVSHSVLPIVTLSAYLVGQNVLIMRAATLGILGEDFVQTLHAVGYSNRTIVYGHVMKNAFLPMLTNIGIQMGFIASGAVLVETVFTYPGTGLLIYQAVLARDYPTLQGAFFVLTVTVLVAVFIADLLNSVLDPRIRR
jgi:peptide/nickel transport system permease protein